MIPLRSLDYGKNAHAVLELVRLPAFRYEALGETAASDESDVLHRAETPDAFIAAYVDALYAYAKSYLIDRAVDVWTELYDCGDVEVLFDHPLVLPAVIALFRDDTPMPKTQQEMQQAMDWSKAA